MTQPILIHLVRHGKVSNPRELVYGRLPGFGLDQEGVDQAQAVADYLGNRPIVGIWSSPLQRATETAAVLARHKGLVVRVDEQLTEWRLTDRWQSHGWAELTQRFPGELEAYLENPTNLGFSAESLSDLALRMSRFIQELVGALTEGELVLVSHQDPVQAARLLLTGRDLSHLHSDKPGHGTVITLAPGEPWAEVTRWDP